MTTGNPVLDAIIAVAAIVGSIWGLGAFIDKRIEAKIKSREFLDRISPTIRPFLIVTERGSIEVDRGAMDWLSGVEVHHEAGDQGLPSAIVVSAKRHLAYPPLIQPLQDETIVVESRRGEKHDWHFALDYIMSNDQFDGRRRFRVEIIG